MKYLNILLFLCLSWTTSIYAQVNYVNVGRAGTLQQILEQKGYMDSEGLVIAGELNGRDIAVLRALTGSQIYHEYSEASGLPSVDTPKLKYINLYDARIVSGTLPYSMAHLDVDGMNPNCVYKWYHTTDDVMGTFMFEPYTKSTITDVVTPASVRRIESSAFCECRNLKTVFISEGIESVNGFFGCNSLKRVVLPSSLTKIEEGAFSSGTTNMTAIENIYCLGTEPPVVENISGTFTSATRNNCIVFVPMGCETVYRNSAWGAFKHITETANMEVLIADMKPVHRDIPVDLIEEQEVVNKVFVEEPGTLQQLLEEYGMTDSEKLVIGGKINGRDILYLRILGGLRNDFQYQDYNYMNDNGFPDKPGTKLNRIDLYDANIVSGGGPYLMDGFHSADMELWRYTEDDVAGEALFEGEWRLREITLPSSIKKMDNRVFWGNISMEGTFVVPDGVESIGQRAFYSCREMEQVVLPAALNSIGTLSFWMCDKLHTVYCLNTTPPVIENAYNMFTEYTLNDGKLIVPAGCAEAYRNAYGWGSFKNIVEADDIEALVAPYKPQHHDFSVPTAVAPVSAYKDGTGTQVFNLSGMRLTQPARGLNIIRTEDGKTRKVVK